MDIDKQLKENIKVELTMLPKETQEVINTFGFKNIFTEISKKHYLSEDEIKTLEVETILVLLGLVNFKFFSKNIENNINTSEEEAGKIANEVVERIFNPIYSKVVEKVKDNIKYKNIDWKQSINFIISGGDYSVFVEK